MFARIYNAIVAVSLSSFLICVGAGCNDSDGSTDDPPQLAVTFNNYNFTYEQCWVVVCSADGQQVLDARRAYENGRLEFDSSLPDSVTLSIITSDLNGMISVESYVNVTLQEWIRNSRFQNSIGATKITASFPDRDYDRLALQTTSWGWDSTDFAGDSAVTGPYDEDRLEDGTMTVFGLIEGDSGDYAGWLLRQPFTPHEINEYHVTLDQPVQTYNVTTTRPANFVDLHGHRSNEFFLPFRLYYDENSDESTDFSLKVPAFPVLYYWTTAVCYQPYYYCQQRSSEVPTSVSIPSGSISETYDLEQETFENIVVQGEADAVWGGWQSVSNDTTVYWAVYSNPNTSELGRPEVPDSVWSSLQVSAAEFGIAAFGMDDFSPLIGWDAYVEMSAGTNGSYHTYCDRLYQSMNRYRPANQAYGPWLLSYRDGLQNKFRPHSE